MTKRNLHVVPHKNGWAVQREGASRPSTVHDTQREAIGTARPRTHKDGVELVIHRKNGTIRDSDSHGHDPCPPRDRR